MRRRTEAIANPSPRFDANVTLELLQTSSGIVNTRRQAITVQYKDAKPVAVVGDDLPGQLTGATSPPSRQALDKALQEYAGQRAAVARQLEQMQRGADRDQPAHRIAQLRASLLEGLQLRGVMPNGGRWQPQGLVRFYDATAVREGREAISARFGPARDLGDHLEYSGRSPTGLVTLRLAKATSLIEYYRVDFDAGGAIEVRTSFQKTGPTTYARVMADAMLTDSQGNASRSMLTVGGLHITKED